MPKGRAAGAGSIQLYVRNANELIKTSGSGFGGSTWQRGARDVSSVNLARFGYGTMRVNGRRAVGRRPMLVIRLQFIDKRFSSSHNYNYYNRLFFGSGRGAEDPSVVNYFLENSYNRFSYTKAGLVTFTNRDDASTPFDERYINCAYNRSCPGATHVWEASLPKTVQQAESVAGFDFRRYDTNGDRVITQDELQMLLCLPMLVRQMVVLLGVSMRTFWRLSLSSLVASVGEGVGFCHLGT